MTGEEVLQSGEHRPVVRIGDVVHRPTYPWSGSVHGLLRHLERVGFDGAPRFLGLDPQGRERLGFIPGESGAVGWSKVVPDEGLVAMARLLRRAHEALQGFDPPAQSRWADVVGAPGPGEIVRHGDPGPWNVVWRGDRPVALLDWDHAMPGDPLDDVAYALEYVAPFRSDEDAMRWHAFGSPPDRRHRIRVFLEAYGADGSDAYLSAMVDRVITEQRRVIERVERLAAAGIQPQGAWAEAGLLPSLRDRGRWSERNRPLFGV